MINIHSADERYGLDLTSSYIAVREAFPHLSVRQIIEPPRDQFDAALARQIALHLMVHHFGWPKRRIVEQEHRSREALNRALRTIDERKEAPRFAALYRRIAWRAENLVRIKLGEAA
jgi:hypothetical protein